MNVRSFEGNAAAAVPMSDGIERYRGAERALLAHYGIEPTERFVDVGSPPARLRVLEVGTGEPVVFVHGTAGAGPVWAPLLRELKEYRCLVLDRPGWGLSESIDFTGTEYKSLIGNLLKDVLDSLGVGQADVIGASIGDVWGLGLATGHPHRARKIVLMGGGPLWHEIQVPSIIRLIASPLGGLMVRLPEKAGRVRSIVKANGDGESLNAGRMEEFVTWRTVLGNETKSMRHERDMVRAIVNWRKGSFRPGLMFAEEELAAFSPPTLMVYGTEDPVGSVDIWRRFVNLMPRGDLHVVHGAGHLPWFHDPAGVAGRVRDFLHGNTKNG
jgi:pimeloyl-ACP methyl ester carboxylesterase